MMTKGKSMSFEYHYNEQDDVLSIYKLSAEVVEAIEFSEFLNLSFDKQGRIVGLEIFDASKFLSIQNPEVTKNFLNTIKSVFLQDVTYRNNCFIAILLKSDKVTITQQLPPLRKGSYESPLLACAK